MPDPRSAVIELAFAGSALAQMQLVNAGLPGRPLMVCGACGFPAVSASDPDEHSNLCPVGRYIRAVEAVRKAAL